MPEPLSHPSERQFLSFSEFLAALLPALDREGVCFCVLRNYEKFPAENIGSDIDFLIHPSDLARAIRALRSVAGIRITGYSERSWVAHAIVEGVRQAPGIRALQVDFLWLLSWKGQTYLPTEAILQAAPPRQTGNLKFLVPSPVHEAIVSLFASLLVGGWLKEKYFPKAQQAFAKDRPGASAALQTQFGLKQTARLVDAVIAGDRKKILGCVGPLRVSVTLRGLMRRPMRGSWAAVLYFAREIAVRFSPRNVETVCILGLNGEDKTMLVESLAPLLQASAKEVEARILRPRFHGARKSWCKTRTDDFSGQSKDGYFSSMAKVLVWLFDDWLRQFIGKKNLTLRICGCSCQDLLIDPAECGYNGPVWFARLASRFSPSPDLWILLDPATRTEGLELSAQTVRQLEAYRSFVKASKQHIILNAGKPAADLTEDAYTAMIDMLAQRTNSKLRNRF